MSKRRKKNKVVKLTERDYGNYIMSLKDEEPIKPIAPSKEKSDSNWGR